MHARGSEWVNREVYSFFFLKKKKKKEKRWAGSNVDVGRKGIGKVAGRVFDYPERLWYTRLSLSPVVDYIGHRHSVFPNASSSLEIVNSLKILTRFK